MKGSVDSGASSSRGITSRFFIARIRRDRNVPIASPLNFRRLPIPDNSISKNNAGEGGPTVSSFDLQDGITESVIGSVAPVLRGAEIERARRKPEADQDIYDLTLRALLPAFAETPEDNEEALRLLARALEMDPAYPTANALAAWCHQQRHLMEWPTVQDDDGDVFDFF
jgi:hypothetical protein